MMYCINEQAPRQLSPLSCMRRLHNYRVDCWHNHYDVLITAPNDRSRPIDLGIVWVP